MTVMTVMTVMTITMRAMTIITTTSTMMTMTTMTTMKGTMTTMTTIRLMTSELFTPRNARYGQGGLRDSNSNVWLLLSPRVLRTARVRNSKQQ